MIDNPETEQRAEPWRRRYERWVHEARPDRDLGCWTDDVRWMDLAPDRFGERFADGWARFLETLTEPERVAADEVLRDVQREAERMHLDRIADRDLERAQRLRLPVRPAIVRALAHRTALKTRMMQVARSWWREREARPVLVLLGPRGCGKTVAAVERIFAHGEGAEYVLADAACRLRGSNFGPDRERFDELVRADLLVLDEIGTEADAAIMARALHEIVDAKVGAGAAILIGNLTPDALRQRLDARTSDRLREVGRIETTAEPSLRGAA